MLCISGEPKKKLNNEIKTHWKFCRLGLSRSLVTRKTKEKRTTETGRWPLTRSNVKSELIVEVLHSTYRHRNRLTNVKRARTHDKLKCTWREPISETADKGLENCVIRREINKPIAININQLTLFITDIHWECVTRNSGDGDDAYQQTKPVRVSQFRAVLPVCLPVSGLSCFPKPIFTWRVPFDLSQFVLYSSIRIKYCLLNVYAFRKAVDLYRCETKIQLCVTETDECRSLTSL